VLEFWDGRDHPLDLEGAREKYGVVARREEPTFAYVIEHGGSPIGYLQFYRVADWPEWGAILGLDDQADVWSVDLFVGEPALWGRGLGTAAVRLSVRHLFDVRRARRVVITPFTWNARAVRSYEKAGFRRVRLLPRAEEHEGVMGDEWLMVVDPPDAG
jgi:aminoglycoside 6'-N-acetyltransferase